MAQWAKVLTAESDTLSSVPETHMAEERTDSNLHTCVLALSK